MNQGVCLDHIVREGLVELGFEVVETIFDKLDELIHGHLGHDRRLQAGDLLALGCYVALDL